MAAARLFGELPIYLSTKYSDNAYHQTGNYANMPSLPRITNPVQDPPLQNTNGNVTL